MDNYSVDFIDGGLPDLETGWYILDVFGLAYAGPYAREKDAKGQLTRLRKGYTPAARKI